MIRVRGVALGGIDLEVIGQKQRARGTRAGKALPRTHATRGAGRVRFLPQTHPFKFAHEDD
jgi:hypothetical protein